MAVGGLGVDGSAVDVGYEDGCSFSAAGVSEKTVEMTPSGSLFALAFPRVCSEAVFEAEKNRVSFAKSLQLAAAVEISVAEDLICDG